jgi:hypothetical protein
MIRRGFPKRGPQLSEEVRMSAQGGMKRNEIEAVIVKKALEDPKFKSRLLQSPKQVVQEQIASKQKDFKLPDGLDVKVLEETKSTLYIVIPRIPAGVAAGELSDNELEAVAGGMALAASSGTVNW